MASEQSIIDGKSKTVIDNPKKEGKFNKLITKLPTCYYTDLVTKE